MPLERLEQRLAQDLRSLSDSGRAKGKETIVTGVIPPANGKGPR